MNDKKFIASLAKVTDPRHALRTLSENEHYLGYDRYYADLRTALLDMADRCANGPVVVVPGPKELLETFFAACDDLNAIGERDAAVHEIRELVAARLANNDPLSRRFWEIAKERGYTK